MRFADLHCHSTFYAFNRMKQSPVLENDTRHCTPWSEMPINHKSMQRGGRATDYSQANFAQLAAGNVQLVFHSFTPIEKGFFVGSTEGDESLFFPELIKLLTGVTATNSLLKLVTNGTHKATAKAARILRNRGPLRQLVQSLVLKYSLPRVRHIISDNYDYWDELLEEYEFLRRSDGQNVQLVTDVGNGSQTINGCYHLIRSADDIAQIAQQDNGDIAVILTIEGAHVFSVDRFQRRHSEEIIFNRIAELKSWAHPIMFISLAHHFDNGLCGHAHSLPDAANLIMDQNPRLNEDFERQNDLGLRVVRELLDLDDDLNDKGGRRIFLDIRHMAARTRKSYYREIVIPYNQKHSKLTPTERKRTPKIPVIMSHSGYAGVSTLDEMIANEHHENDHWHKNHCYAWNINLSDEDIHIIFESEGLVGVCMDQRILGKMPGEKLAPERSKELLFNQIFKIVDVVMLDDRIPAKKKPLIWDRICLGSDYDGVIDPLNSYATASKLPDFAADFKQHLETYRHTRMIDILGIDNLVEKIAWRNAYEFAMIHIPTACRNEIKNENKLANLTRTSA